MRRRILLSDDMVEAKLQEHEKLQYRLTKLGDVFPQWKAEVIGPLRHPYLELIGREAFGSDKLRATENLIGQLARNGFIGRLVPVNIGRGPHTDLVDHDPLSDEEGSDRLG
jgi:hypothetical protein